MGSHNRGLGHCSLGILFSFYFKSEIESLIHCSIVVTWCRRGFPFAHANAVKLLGHRVCLLAREIRMKNKLYVGNLSWNSTEADLSDTFSAFGEVVEAKIITDRETGRSRGFAFVTMSDEASANQAAAELDGTSIDGRNVRVNIAEDKRRDGGGGGGGRGGRGGGGGGGGRQSRW